MSSNDFGDLMENENEANDRSIMEWDFANSMKYWTGQDADSSLDINDVSLELVQSDTQIQNPKNSGKYFTDSSENFIEKKLSPQQNNVQETFTFTTVSLNKMPNTYDKKKKVTNLVEGSCNEYDSVLDTGLHLSTPHLDRNLESNINIKDFPIVSNSSHHSKGIISYRNKNTSNENLNLPSNLINETKDNGNKENPLRRYYSTINLKEPNIYSKGSVHHSSQASISKSRSLSNLSNCKPQTYDNIESKVKKYIQEQKRESKLRRDSKVGTKSLPVTPIRSKESRGLLDSDENYFKNLCLSRKKEKEDLPEDLKNIKQKILEGNIDINLVEKLFNRLEKERECCNNQNIMLNVYQLQYDKLLGKYAEAKNDIDYLRFNRDTNYSEEHSQSGKLGKFSNFQKAFSTSNIFAECSVPFEFGSAKPLSNLIRYSSTPQVHPEITEECKENSEGKFSHLNESFMNECSLSGSSVSFKGDVNDWNEKFNHLKQKLKEYVILENNAAFNKEERETVWNYVLKLFSKLSKGLPPENNCKLKLEELHESINVVARNFSLHLPQNFSLNDDDESAVSTPGFCDNLPTNSCYPKLVNEPRFQDKLDFPKSDFSALTNNSRTNDKSKLSFLKYSNARDADSGCPPSDRSTRNSHFPSFDPFESLGTNGIGNEVSLNLSEYKNRGLDQGEVFRRRSIDNLSQVSDNCRSIRLNSRKKNNIKKLRSKSLMNLDEDYDASESSEFEDSIYNDDKTRKYLRKPVKSPKTTKYLSKFEDKFICQDQIASSDSHSSKYEGNKCIIDMSQMEKNSKYFKHQVQDLQSKGLHRKKNKSKRLSLPNRPNTPFKALAKEPLNMSRFSLNPKGLSNTFSVSNEKQLGMSRPSLNLSIYSGRSNTIEKEESKLYNENSFSFTQKNRNKLISTSTPKSSHNYEKSDDSAQSKGRYRLSSDISFDKTTKYCPRSSIGTSEMQVDTSTVSIPHCCDGKPYVMVCCCHSSQLPKPQCLRTSCEHKAAANSPRTKVDSEKLMTYLNSVTERAESVRMDTQASLNLFRSKMLPVTRR